MVVGVVRETFPGERRVALVPDVVPTLTKAGVRVAVEAGAGQAAGFTDADYRHKGAEVAPSREEVFASADVVCQVRTASANPRTGGADLSLMRQGQTLIGFAEPLTDAGRVAEMAERGVQVFSLELVPRITRAQAMDVLSSQAMIAGYKAVLLAANTIPKMFPMMVTAAGTVTPTRVFVIGAGVAGLQAISTARRLGAVVEAYDVRPAVKEQVESLGARFLEIALDTSQAEDKSGYARALDDSAIRAQRQLMAKAVAGAGVVITTAAVPGKKSPVLVTEEMVREMAPASVIVDLAAERGGNCEMTRADETVTAHGVTILGPTNLPSTAAFHASQLYARNVVAFLKLMLTKEGGLKVDTGDEIIEQTLLTRDGRVVHARVREILGLEGGLDAATAGSAV